MTPAAVVGAAVALAGTDPDAPRRQAEAILRERRFRPVDVPQPLRRPLHSLGDALTSVLDRLAALLPGGHVTLWLLLAAAVLALSTLLTAKALRRRRAGDGPAYDRRTAPAGTRPEDPAWLERRAEEAEGAGDYAAAVRLRFRAGLLRLDAREAIALRPSLTSGEVARRLRSSTFVGLAATFDAVAYGGARPGVEDARAARAGWQTVLSEVAGP